MKKDAAVPKKKHPVRKGILLGIAALVVCFVGYRLVSGYINTLPKLTYAYGAYAQQAKYPECNFAVLSDLHQYAPSLGTTGKAFQDYLDYDRKLLRESNEILDTAVNNILASGVQFVLVSGDLTKDGEKLNHEQVAQALKRITDKGIKVFVVPGNHDVNNGWAYSFDGDKTTPVPTVTADEFADIYKGCGYGDALYRDSGSLSYVAEPVEGMWLICLDACRYRENKPNEEAIVAGKFSQSQETWLEGMLQKARESNKAVMVMMHHGVVEHWPGQVDLHPDYLVEDYKHISEMLASWGARIVFTGHYHAQDIARADFGSKGFIFDVETGSLVTSPCPMRWCRIDAQQNFAYTTDLLVKVLHPKSSPQGTDFEAYAATFIHEAVYNEAFATLRKYYVSEEDAKTIAENVAVAFEAHYAGDEYSGQRPPLDAGKLNLWSQVVLSMEKYVLDGLWNDPSVKEDNNGSVNLVTGK